MLSAISLACEQTSIGFRKRQVLPAVWMRAGTSKGLYIHRKDLPPYEEQWNAIIGRAMGSYDSDPKQLNGIGGGTSTTSKVAIISRSKRPGIDIDYTFTQCSVGSPKLDWSGNCGNIASGVGPFALDEGLIIAEPGQREVEIRIYNTNTDSCLVETIQVDENGRFLEDGNYKIAGVLSAGSCIKMAFIKPAGAMTGSFLPSGRPADTLSIQTPMNTSPFSVRISAVDAANPFIFVDAACLPSYYHELGSSSKESLGLIEVIRRRGSVLMGLARNEDEAASTRGTPKIAVLSPLPDDHVLDMPDIQVTAYSMGKSHSSLQLTGAVCLASAVCTEGTIAHELRRKPVSKGQNGQPKDGSMHETIPLQRQTVKLKHPGGIMTVEVTVEKDRSIRDVTVFRTARRMFEGKVYYLM